MLTPVQLATVMTAREEKLAPGPFLRFLASISFLSNGVSCKSMLPAPPRVEVEHSLNHHKVNLLFIACYDSPINVKSYFTSCFKVIKFKVTLGKESTLSRCCHLTTDGASKCSDIGATQYPDSRQSSKVVEFHAGTTSGSIS